MCQDTCSNNPVKYVDPSGFESKLPKGLQRIAKVAAFVYNNKDAITKIAVGGIKLAGGVAIAIAGSAGGAGISVGTGGTATVGGAALASAAIAVGGVVTKEGAADILEGIQALKKLEIILTNHLVI